MNSGTTVIGCVFLENHSLDGGGMCNTEGSRALVRDCSFVSNWANFGGAVANWESNPRLTACFFDGNSAADRGGALYNYQGSSPLVFNSVFRGNAAVLGSAISNRSDGFGVFTNCTVVGNLAADSGGGMHNDSSDVRVYNTIFRGNGAQPIANDQSSPVIRYCNIEGGYKGVGNIDVDPLFVRNPHPGPDGEWGTDDDDYGDLDLLPASPCIDAGWNTVVPRDAEDVDNDGDTDERFPFDLGGDPRFVDDPDTDDTGRCGEPCELPIVDMGAYEYQIDGCVREPAWQCDGDVDGDGQVNPVDAGLVQAAFCGGENCGDDALCQYDVDCDGQINPVDAGIVQSLFGICEEPRGVCP